MNSNHIAYELMNNDPLNEQSVEYLSSQQLVWTEQCKERQQKQEESLREVEKKYADYQIGFS